MVFNTATVSTAVTPIVIQTFFNHYLNRKPLAQKPTAHISYDEGLHLIRKFLLYASHNTVEDVQRFTSQWVPHPTWVKVDEATITEEHLKKSAEAIQEQLGPHGISKVGGKSWWQWRRPESELKAEWIEMRADYYERKKTKDPGRRIMLYVHGGAYFFGSVDEHRYQLQRHARKLKARVFARYESRKHDHRYILTSIARYRLAPQFPFPCGLHDCLAAYLHLLSAHDPTTIILAGDSAGGGMVVSMLVTLRDRGIPLPAGAILISPWVDLTHSFPSVAGDNPFDYIPAHGFHQRPSSSWPPPNADDMLAIEEGIVKKLAHADHASFPQQSEADAIQGFHVDKPPDDSTKNATADTGTATNDPTGPTANTVPGAGHDLSIMIDGKLVEVKDQIQMYATNQLISHPLVSPILQPSLGGLPPLLILTGGGEALRDEQIYLAHKAANPTKYPPGDAFLDESPYEHNRNQVNKWKPTDVQLQVWDDLCHVAPTLSFTRPAKYMYRSIAQFGAWALARAQKTEIDILDDDDVSVISTSSSSSPSSDDEAERKHEQTDGKDGQEDLGQIGKAGDPLPPFKNHMIRQRVNRHGKIYTLELESKLAACSLPANEIGVIKEGPVKKWITAKKQWDTKFASSKRKVQKQRAKEIARGYYQFGEGEVPPPSALAGRRHAGGDLKEKKKGKSYGMSLWALWGSKHDKMTTEREQKADKEPEVAVATSLDGANARPLDDVKTKEGKKLDGHDASRSRSRRRTVTDQNQTGYHDADEDTPAAELNSMLAATHSNGLGEQGDGSLTPDFMSNENMPSILVRSPTFEKDESELKRPKAGGIAFPFSLKQDADTASMMTLTSSVGVPPIEDLHMDDNKNSGIAQDGTEKEAAASASTEKGKGTERPPLGTFGTALEDLPVVNKEE